MQQKQRVTYEDWMAELQLATTVDDNPGTRLPGMVTAASMMAKLAPNPKQARHDIALVLASKYQEEMGRANGNSMLTRPIEEKYDTVANVLFKSKFQNLLNYIYKHEPHLDPRNTNIQQGKTPPGFIGVETTYDEKTGEARPPLGFMTRPKRVNEETGEVEPGLGFLDEGHKRGGLGFL